MQKQWTERQFNSKDFKRREIGQRITLDKWEIREAMKRIAKDKANSVDGLLDLMYQDKEHMAIVMDRVKEQIRDCGFKEAKRIKEKALEELQDTLAQNLATYYNEIIEGDEFPHRQGLLEQIFIPKDDSRYKSFDNSRPITKTSPVYKLLDTVLNNRLKKELNPGGKFILEREQIGFREGKGCEINILKLKQTLRQRLQSGKKPWALFIDLKSAFDKVNHDYLFAEMKKYGITETLINTIKWLYQTTKIQVGEEQIDIGSGVL